MATYSGPDVKSDNLIFSMDAANPRSYPGSGNILYDLCGRNNLTMSNVTYSSSGIPHFSFNGTNSYCHNTTVVNGLEGTNQASIIAWVNTATVAGIDGTYNGIVALGTKGCNLGSGRGQSILFSMASTRRLTMAKWCDDSTNGTLVAPANTWAMISLVKNGASTRFSVNNTFENSSNTGTENFTGTNFTIGATDNPGNRLFTGLIGSVYIYRGALSDTDITNIYLSLKGKYGI